MANEPKSTIDEFAANGLGSKTDNWLAATFGYLNCLGYVQIEVTDSEPVSLFTEEDPIPDGTVYALIVIEGDETNTDAENNKCVRFREDGLVPNSTTGMPLTDSGNYDCKGVQALNQFLAIGVPSGKTQIMNIQFYG